MIHVKLILRYYSYRGRRKPKGRTLVHLAAENGRVEILDKLKDKGAPMDEMDSLGETPLHLAAKNGKAPAVKYLLQYSKVDSETYHHQTSITPLDKAIAKGCRYEISAARLIIYFIKLISANAEMLLKSY